MSSLEEYLGIEKLDENLANKESGYAYVNYLETIESTDINSKGELIQSNRESIAGQIDLVSVAEFERIVRDFPNKVKGNTIKYGNLENMLSLIFDTLKAEYSKISENDEFIDSKIQYLDSFFSNGRLTADHQNKTNLDDLANKVFSVQESIRNLQSRSLKSSNTINL